MSVYHHDNRRVIRRLIGFGMIVIAVASMIGLYYVKIRAQSAKSGLARIEQAIAIEANAVSILRAELAYLQSPDRLQVLSDAHLGLAPISVKQTLQASDIEDLFPVRPDVKSAQSDAQPAAIVMPSGGGAQ